MKALKFLALALLLSLSLAEKVMAADTWTGGGTDNNWSGDTANWGGVTPVSGDSLIFDGSARLNPNNNFSTFIINNLTFSSTAGAFVLGGNKVSLKGGITDNNASLVETVGFGGTNSLVTTPSQTFSVAAGGTLNFGGTWQGTGFGINKTSGGTLIISGTTQWTGATQVTGGTLIVNGTSSGSALTVNSGTTLGGTGSIIGTTNTINGNVQVGAGGTDTTSILHMSASTSTTFSGANLSFNLDTASTASNTLDLGATSNVLFNGTNTLTFNLQGGATIPGSTSYLLFTDSTTGTSPFSGTGGFSVDGTGKISGFNLVFDINGTSTSLYDGSYLQLVNLGAGGYAIDIITVPEPGTWALMLGGLALLVIVQRRRRSAHV